MASEGDAVIDGPGDQAVQASDSKVVMAVDAGHAAQGNFPHSRIDTPGAIAVAFLRRFHPTSLWGLCCFGPGEQEVGPARAFDPAEEAAARSFIDAVDGKHNVYFTVNVMRCRLAKKAAKKDIVEVSWLHSDGDLNKNLDWSDLVAVAAEKARVLQRLRSYIPMPTAIIWSGGGFQAFWRLSEIICVDGNKQLMASIERRMQLIERTLGTDACHNVDRIMRLPGTLNVLGPTKFRAGRKPARAELVEFHQDRIYDIEEFPELAASTNSQNGHAQHSSRDRAEVERIREALRAIPADNYDVYLRVGMAIKAELGDAGFDLYRDWAMRSIKFDDDDIRGKWASIKPEGGITIATLFHIAKEHGWQPEREHHKGAGANHGAGNHTPNGRGRRDGRSNGHAPKAPSDEPTKEEVDAEIARLAKLDPVQFERERKKVARQLGFRPNVLDWAVKAARGETGEDEGGQGRPLSLDEPTPCDDPVDGCELLDALVAGLHRYVVLGKNEARAIALWILHTYLFSIFTCTPRLAITSPEKRCGKTTLMDVLTCLLSRVLSVAGISAPAIFRTVELARPTLLIDEADTFLPQNEELRGVLNSGHRKGGSVVRLVGDEHEPRRFSTHAPVAIAMIGKLPGTLADRSIPICLRRRRPDEPVQSFRADRTDDLDRLASMSARWAIDIEAAIRDIDPDMAGLFNRDADNWRPLLAIADAAGGPWPTWAREAARTLVADAAADDESTGAMLLADTRTAFETKAIDRISSEELVEYLHGLEGRPWPEFGKSRKPISKTQLAKLLRHFKISPGTIRLEDGTTPKGYYRKDFEDAFRRYIPPHGSFEQPHRHTPRASRDSADFEAPQAGSVWRLDTGQVP